jgi:hypothetical protein
MRATGARERHSGGSTFVDERDLEDLIFTGVQSKSFNESPVHGD